MSAFSILKSSSYTLLNMMRDLCIDTNVQKSIVSKIMNIAVRGTCYLFCRRNKTRAKTKLLNF